MGRSILNLRLAVSGTYSTGKTTTTEALALWTGIPRTQARTMREILPEALPGKALEDCTPAELFQLGLLRFTERAVREEAMGGDFISDGSSLHEWVYGKARMSTGINPSDNRVTRAMKLALLLPHRRVIHQVYDAFGAVVKQHAKKMYREFIHLPIEFPLVKDGHRPVSEEFRRLSDQLLRKTLDELGIKYHIVPGTIEQRLLRIAEIYDLSPQMPLQQAISDATARVRAFNAEIEVDAQRAALARQTAPWQQRLRQRLRA